MSVQSVSKYPRVANLNRLMYIRKVTLAHIRLPVSHRASDTSNSDSDAAILNAREIAAVNTRSRLNFDYIEYGCHNMLVSSSLTFTEIF